MPEDTNPRFGSQLSAFMHSISQIESGGRYDIMGPHTRYGRPRGKYQILDSNWNAWAREAGIPGADWRSPAAQERVAAYKFRQYYEQFGSWEAVAVAWFAGPGRAADYAQGSSEVRGYKDVLGTSVSQYANRAVRGMEKLGVQPAAGIATTHKAATEEAFGNLDKAAQLAAETVRDRASRVMGGISKALGIGTGLGGRNFTEEA